MADYTQIPLVGSPQSPPPSIIAAPAIKIAKPKWARDSGVSELIEYFDRSEIANCKSNAERWSKLKLNEVSEIMKVVDRCRKDFQYCARNFFWLSTKDRGDKLFTLWEGQCLLLEFMLQLKAKNRAQRVLIIKGRQLGCSTLIEALIAWRTMLFVNVTAFVIADEPARATELFGLMTYFLDHVPWWLQPMIASREYKEGLKFANPDPEQRRADPGLNSKVIVNAANKLTGVAQGYKVNCAHCCFIPSTLVRTAGGVIKPVLEVKSGDNVLNSMGRITTVKQVVKSGRRNEVTTGLRIWGNACPIETTIDHKLLTPNGFVAANELESGDYVRLPVRQIDDSIKVMEFTEKLIGGSGKGKTRRHRTVVLPCSYEWGWFMGLYLAEGHVDSGIEKYGQRLTFGIHEDEAALFKPRLEAALGPKFKVGINKSKSSKTLALRVSWTGLGKYIAEQFGRTDSKRLPDWVWSAGTDFCKGLVNGYFEGDGHISKGECSVRASSTRVAITVQMRDLVASLGYGWSGISYREAGFHYGRNCKAIWTLVTDSETAANLRAAMGYGGPPSLGGDAHWKYAEGNRFVDLEIESRFDGFSEEFYDLEVQSEDHAFCTFQACAKNSEFPSWVDRDARTIIEEDLGNALADNVETFAFLEGTAKGAGRYAHKLWVKSFNLGDDSKWAPIFLPSFFESSRVLAPPNGWMVCQEEEDVRERVLREWTRCDSEQCRQYHERWFRGNDRDGEICPTCEFGTLRPYSMSDEQCCWFERERKNCENDPESLKAMNQELCISAEDSFQASGYKSFSDLAQNAAKKYVEEPYSAGIVDKSAKFHGCDPRKKRPGGTPEESWNACFQPDCKSNHQFDKAPLQIFRFPEKSRKYFIGADVGEGLGGDNNSSVAFVLKQGILNQPDEQVAVYRSNTVDRISYAEFLVSLGYFYNKALIAVESNKFDTVASWVQTKLLYPNCYRPRLESGNVSIKLGWDTTERSKGRLYDTMYRWLEAHQIVIHSRNFVEEMKTFKRMDNEKGNGRSTYGASKGFQDDELLAGMIALFVCHAHDYDENLGYVAMKADVTYDNSMWQARCGSCNERWGVQSTSELACCPKCRSLHISAQKNPNYVKESIEDPEMELMIGESSREPESTPDYDML